jgi:hypothetical protein
VDASVGCGAYRLDLAVRHPKRAGVYALAVETDGPSYATAATARDRDRLRFDVLNGQRGLGWRLHRIWSTDWWFDREREASRLVEAVEAALVAEPEPPVVEVPAAGVPVEVPSDSDILLLDESGDVELVDEPTRVSETSPVIPYERAEVTQRSGDPSVIFTTPWVAQIRDVLAAIAKVEAPIHVDELCRRAGSAFGVARLSQRMKTRFLEIAPRTGISIRGEIAWLQGNASFDRIRGTGPDGYVRAADYIPPQELSNAAEWILSENISMPKADLIREMARVFGLQRAKATVAGRMLTGIQSLQQRGGCTIEGESVSYREGAPVSRFFVPNAARETGPKTPPMPPSAQAMVVTPMPPPSPVPGPVPNALAVSLAKSRVFMARTNNDQRRAQVISLVAFLAERSGQAPLQTVARELKWNPARAGGLIAMLSENLNHDGYEILQHDPATQQVMLDVEKLRILYALEC